MDRLGAARVCTGLPCGFGRAHGVACPGRELGQSWTTSGSCIASVGMSDFSERAYREAVADSFSAEEATRLNALLEANAPMREDVLTLVAQFRLDLGPFFLRALLDRLEGNQVSHGDPLVDALRAAFAMPAGELADFLLAGEEEVAAA